MKKGILLSSILVASGLLVVSCGKKNTDASLDGTWLGQTTAQTQFQIQGQTVKTTNSGSTAQTESVVLEFNHESLKISRIQKPDILTTDEKELSVGSYQLQNQQALYTVASDSCAGETRSASISFTYTIKDNVTVPNSSVTATELDVTFGNGGINPETIIFYKKIGRDEQNTEAVLSNSTLGCFAIDKDTGKKIFRVGALTPRS